MPQACQAWNGFRRLETSRIAGNHELSFDRSYKGDRKLMPGVRDAFLKAFQPFAPRHQAFLSFYSSLGAQDGVTYLEDDEVSIRRSPL